MTSAKHLGFKKFETHDRGHEIKKLNLTQKLTSSLQENVSPRNFVGAVCIFAPQCCTKNTHTQNMVGVCPSLLLRLGSPHISSSGFRRQRSQRGHCGEGGGTRMRKDTLSVNGLVLKVITYFLGCFFLVSPYEKKTPPQKEKNGWFWVHTLHHCW